MRRIELNKLLAPLFEVQIFYGIINHFISPFLSGIFNLYLLINSLDTNKCAITWMMLGYSFIRNN